MPVVSGYGRPIHFSGYDWLAKISTVRVGPGPNYFSDSEDNVWIDAEQRLHLRVTQDASGNWNCAEVVLQQSFGYGTYRFQLDGPPRDLDDNVVLGLFTWNDDSAENHREMDIEFARWGERAAPNGRYTVQPYQQTEHIFNFDQPLVGAQTTHQLEWQPGRATFRGWMGWNSGPTTSENLIAEHVFESGIPKPGGEQTRMNLWLNAGLAPVDGEGTEVVINLFEFVPAAAATSLDI